MPRDGRSVIAALATFIAATGHPFAVPGREAASLLPPHAVG